MAPNSVAYLLMFYNYCQYLRILPNLQGKEHLKDMEKNETKEKLSDIIVS